MFTYVGAAYQWYKGGVAIGGANGIIYPAIISGDYTVKVFNASGCTTTSAVTTITVNPLPVVVTNQTVLLGTTGSIVFISATVSGGSGSNYTYQWKNGSGTIAGENLSYYNATVSDTYSVLVTDGNACTTTSNPIPVIINASEQYSFCTGDSTIFQFDKSTVSGNPTVTWEYSANNSSWSTLTTGITNVTATLQYCTAKIAGYYRVRLDGTSTIYSTVQRVIVNTNPSLSIETLAVINTNSASTLYLPYTGSESLTNYSVTPGSTNALPSFTSVTNAVVTSSPLQVGLPMAAAAGTYNFYLLVKNANGCISDTNNLVLAVKPKIISENGQTTNINSKAVNQYGAKAFGLGRTPNGKLIALSTPVLISTTTVNGITSTTASSGGVIKIDGGSAITARGICWNTTGSPTTTNNKTVVTGTTGSFSSNLSGLTAGTTYYVRAYATNSLGTVYGEVQSFTTAP